MLLPVAEKLAVFRDPGRTRAPRTSWPSSPDNPLRTVADWADKVIFDVVAPENEQYRGPLGRRHRRRSRGATRGTSCATLPWPTTSTPASARSRRRTIPTRTGRRAWNLAGPPRRDRRVRCRRPPRPAGLVQLRHRAAGQGRARSPAPFLRGGDPSHDRCPGPALRAQWTGPCRRRLVRRPGRPRSRPPSAATTSPCASTSPAAPVGSTPRPRHRPRPGQWAPDRLRRPADVERSGTLLRSGRDTATAPLS